MERFPDAPRRVGPLAACGQLHPVRGGPVHTRPFAEPEHVMVDDLVPKAAVALVDARAAFPAPHDDGVPLHVHGQLDFRPRQQRFGHFARSFGMHAEVGHKSVDFRNHVALGIIERRSDAKSRLLEMLRHLKVR